MKTLQDLIDRAERDGLARGTDILGGVVVVCMPDGTVHIVGLNLSAASAVTFLDHAKEMCASAAECEDVEDTDAN